VQYLFIFFSSIYKGNLEMILFASLLFIPIIILVAIQKKIGFVLATILFGVNAVFYFYALIAGKIIFLLPVIIFGWIIFLSLKFIQIRDLQNNKICPKNKIYSWYLKLVIIASIFSLFFSSLGGTFASFTNFFYVTMMIFSFFGIIWLIFNLIMIFVIFFKKIEKKAYFLPLFFVFNPLLPFIIEAVFSPLVSMGEIFYGLKVMILFFLPFTTIVTLFVVSMIFLMRK
jgi:hypothetical protein